MWFCTWEGLSRFDGYKFTNYGTDEGLPHAIVNDTLETREGDYWVATARGLCKFDFRRLNPRDPLFRCYVPYQPYGSVTKLFQDRAGRIWCGTENGLYRLKLAKGHDPVFEYIDLGMASNPRYHRWVTSILADRVGNLWVGSGGGLYCYSGAGLVERFTTKQGFLDDVIHDVAEDREGRLWVAAYGVYRLVPEPRVDRPIVEHVYTTTDGLRSNFANSFLKAADGTLWVGTRAAGFSKFVPQPGGPGRFATYVLPVPDTIGADSLGQDRDGNFWIGSGGGGIIKIANSGLTSFRLPARSLFSSNLGTCVRRDIGDDSGALFLGCLDGDRFQWVEPRHPKYFGWGWLQLDFQDRNGEWWIATGEGLYRFPRVARLEQLGHTPPKVIYQKKDGLPGDDIFRLFEDSRGDVWIAVVGSSPPNRPSSDNGVARWARASDAIQRFPEMDDFRWGLTQAFAEDQFGDIWIAIDEKLVRYREGRFSSFGKADGLPGSTILSLHADAGGRLWIGTRGGLFRVDSPADDRLRLLRYSVRDGLSSNTISAITEDQLGRIYVVTPRGVDRLELAGARFGSIRHYSEQDGLPISGLDKGWSDRNGALWFSGPEFLTRLAPQRESLRDIPVTRISGLRINGTAYALSELGETEIKNLQLRPDQRNLQVDFSAISFAPLRYQYKLEGADRDWSLPSDRRVVNYASLAPGSYRFLARAINADGAASARLATIDFTILSPFWRRWWFLASCMVAITLIAYRFHRYRIAYLVQLERVRTRLATDLHDDIGASLSQIAVVSEVLSRHSSAGEGLRDSLSQIAIDSRELVASMSDIVWAIDPRRDHLHDLIRRMRRFATDMFTGRNIQLEFNEPGTDLRLNADQRRHIFLIFKEAVNNIARHSECTAAEVCLGLQGNTLILDIRDNGRGLDSSDPHRGNGLSDMRLRAETLGGGMEMSRHADRGTRITVRVPLRHVRAPEKSTNFHLHRR
jgi:signal transduction histidine kinase/ligand-binding sensor domain-containing protein